METLLLYRSSWFDHFLPALLGAGIPAMLFGPVALHKLLARWGIPWAVKHEASAPLWALLALGFGLPLLFGGSTAGYLFTRLGGFDEVRLEGERLSLRHSLRGREQAIQRDEIVRLERVEQPMRRGWRAHGLRLHLRDGTHLDSERGSDAGPTQRAVERLGLPVAGTVTE